MAEPKPTELSFELDYLFETEKNIFLAFETSQDLYKSLHHFDKQILRNIHPDIIVEYQLESLEYSSLKSGVAQILKSIPDELLKDPSIKKIIGFLLVKAKYWLIKKLNDSSTIDSKAEIESVADKINNEIRSIGKNSGIIVTTISTLSVLNSLSEIADKTNKLAKKESYEYKSKFGNAILKKGIFVNKPKILSELGQKSETNETKEIVKPKKVDLLSELSKWDFIYNGKTKQMRIEDKVWLESFHRRETNLASGDSLQVVLRTTFSHNSNYTKTTINYDIIRVIKIISPENNGLQLKIGE